VLRKSVGFRNLLGRCLKICSGFGSKYFVPHLDKSSKVSGVFKSLKTVSERMQYSIQNILLHTFTQI